TSVFESSRLLQLSVYPERSEGSPVAPPLAALHNDRVQPLCNRRCLPSLRSGRHELRDHPDSCNFRTMLVTSRRGETRIDWVISLFAIPGIATRFPCFMAS